MSEPREINPPEGQTIDCKECNGHGYELQSCCGDDMIGLDFDLCPTCHEHCSTERMDGEECEACNGTGKIEYNKQDIGDKADQLYEEKRDNNGNA